MRAAAVITIGNAELDRRPALTSQQLQKSTKRILSGQLLGLEFVKERIRRKAPSSSPEVLERRRAQSRVSGRVRDRPPVKVGGVAYGDRGAELVPGKYDGRASLRFASCRDRRLPGRCRIAAGTLYASNRLIQTDPQAVRAFVAAWIETVNYMRAHKAQTVKIESGITGFPESVMSKDYDLTIGMFTKACQFDAESLATLKRSFIDLKLLPSPPDMSKLYTDAFLPPK